MLREFLDTTMLFDLPILAMCFFVAMFLAVLVRVSQRARRKEYDRMSTLPLSDDADVQEVKQ